MSWPFPAALITIGTFDDKTPFVDVNNTFETWNTFWGLHLITTTGNSVLNFDSTVTQHSSISGSAIAIAGAAASGWTGLVF